MRRNIQAALATLVLFAAPAWAQDASVRGVIKSYQGTSLEIVAADGTASTITIGGDSKLIGLTAAKLTDVKVGDFVGVGSLPAADGGQSAVEVTIFPPAMAGTGEGSYPWSSRPEGTMTNATVSNAVTDVGKNSLTLKYKGGEKSVAIPAEAPVVLIGPATAADLTPGAAVMVRTAPDASGAMTAKFVAIGMNGVVPPM